MEYHYHKDFMNSVRALYQKGGKYQKAASQVQAVIGRIHMPGTDPFRGLTLTNNGEKRINKCLKYDLIGFARLVTIHDSGLVLFCFAGEHTACDNWLGKHRGYTMLRNEEGKIEIGQISSLGDHQGTRPSGPSALTAGKLYEGIQPDTYFDSLVEGVPRGLVRQLENLESTNEEEDIDSIVLVMEDTEQAQAIYDVFALLRQDKRPEALERIKVHLGEIRTIDQLSEEEIRELAEGENIKKLRADDPRFEIVFGHFVKSASYMDWMLFLHPDQQKIVDVDFSGPAKLTGVSGSGKTCIVVKRAIRLAEKYKGKKILILTLNRQLARLIEDMVDSACTQDLRESIHVMPFFTLCQQLLQKYEPKNGRLYDDTTWKSKEHVDEIWREYYRCELNNKDAEILIPVHDSLIARGVDAEQYICEEFDWVRSAVPPEHRNVYLKLERKGRGYPLEKKYRQYLLNGLHHWEKKMRAVGVTDYLGLSSALHPYQDRIGPQYRCIIVDESQDFGTIEFQLIRKLAASDENDLFFCGDIAQQVSAKHLSFRDAGITVSSACSKKIQKNYRNSREILKAAYDVLVNNLAEEVLDASDFEILDPEYANFSAAPPLMLRADNLEQEIAFALEFMKEDLGDDLGKKGCLAICGFSLYQIQKYGEKLDVKVLDGDITIEQDNLYISDLEHTKGFEFDTMVIVNCNENIIPDTTKPEDEQFRDLSRLYVSMTRSKNQLVVSFSGTQSPFLMNAEKNFLTEEWKGYVSNAVPKLLGVPPTLDDIRRFEEGTLVKEKEIMDMSGPEFLYTRHALALNSLLIEKLRNVVNGKSLIRDGYPIQWKSLNSAKLDIVKNARSRQAFGATGITQFRELLNKIEALESFNGSEGKNSSDHKIDQALAKTERKTLKLKKNDSI